MAHLSFPGGPVEIDPQRVWRKLAEWLTADSMRSYGLTGARGEHECTLSTLAGECSAKSELSPADAVANALQAFFRREWDAPDRDDGERFMEGHAE